MSRLSFGFYRIILLYLVSHNHYVKGFDGVYAPLFRAGGSHLRTRDFPNLYLWLKRCWNIPGVKDTIDLEDANASYYKQLFPLNPGGLVPTSVTAKEIGLE